LQGFLDSFSKFSSICISISVLIFSTNISIFHSFIDIEFFTLSINKEYSCLFIGELSGNFNLFSIVLLKDDNNIDKSNQVCSCNSLVIFISELESGK
jgi:hypothetical protein